MVTCRHATMLAALTLVGASMIAEVAYGQDVHCRRGEQVRRVAVQLADDADGLPCRVVWQEGFAGGNELVWTSDSEAGFCTGKARELVGELEALGWTCINPIAGFEDEAAIAVTARPERSAPAAVVPDRAAPARRAPALQSLGEVAPSAGVAPPETTPPAHRAILEEALARDIERLDRLAGSSAGGFALQTALLGDLDGDGIDDAVALLTHRADGAPPTHHLLAYRFDGETFQPVARVNLEAVRPDFAKVELLDIDGGVVRLVLHVQKPGDQACCPSGRRPATFVLRDQQLVDLAKDRPGA
jgi:hypothetical protein